MLQNAEAEQSIIGLALSDYSCAERLSQLPKDAFTAVDHVALYEAVKALIAKHEQPDLISVNNLIGGTNKAAAALMVKCISLGVSPAMYDQYENIVLDMRRRRLIQAACLDLTRKAGDPLEDVDSMTARLQAVINDNPGRPQSVGLQEVLLDFMENVGKKTDFISTGIGGFDRLNGGFRPGQLIYLGARPGVGKTALGLAICKHVAQKSGPVLIISLEMRPDEIVERLVASESGVSLGKIVSHSLDDDDWPVIAQNVSSLGTYPIRIAMARTPLKIKQEAASMIRDKAGLKLIMIDYIGLLRGDEKFRSRYEEVSDISRQLKLMAMELNVPILSLTQFNRNPEHGSAKPSMADARDSGSLEQDANVFLVQYAPKDLDPSDALYGFWRSCQDRGTEFQMLNCEKYRQGKTGKIPMEFDKPHMRFTSLTKG